MRTAMQEAIEIIEERLKILSTVQRTESTMGAIAGYQYSKYLLMELLEKEKEQIIAGVRYGQNNHTENVYEEGEIYYNEIYNSDTKFIKSSIPNGNIEITKTNNL